MDVHLIFVELACSPYLGGVLLDRYSLPSEILENGSFEKGELGGKCWFRLKVFQTTSPDRAGALN